VKAIHINSKRIVLAILTLSTFACAKSATSTNHIASAGGENMLTSSKWSQCTAVLGRGSDILFEKRNVEFTADGHIVMEPVSLSVDSLCKHTITRTDATAKFGEKAALNGKIVLGYRVGATADSSGHYDFDVLYGADGMGTNEYTKLVVEGDKLRISKVCNFEDADAGRCEERSMVVLKSLEPTDSIRMKIFSFSRGAKVEAATAGVVDPDYTRAIFRIDLTFFNSKLC
jgi:hypothetical protein